MPQRLRGEVHEIGSLSAETRQEMFELYQQYYGGVDEKMFLCDLKEKQRAILLCDTGGRIYGFTTLRIDDYTVNGKQLRSVFSGDTIVHHHYWGEQTLPLTWCRYAGQLKALRPDIPLYWFLIVKGHRTYRYLRLFSKVFYPADGKPTPPAVQTIMDQIARARYGDNYHADTGLVHFQRTRGYLKREWSGLDEVIRQKPDVRFFLQKNPDYQQGDELVCLTELSADNLRRFALKAFREGRYQ